MLNLHSRTRRVVVTGGFVLAIAAAPAAAFLAVGTPAPAPMAACPAGEIEDLFTDQCIPKLSPNTEGGAYPTHSPNMADVGNTPGLQDVPCAGAIPGECLEREAPSAVPGAEAGTENLNPGADTSIGGENTARD